MPDIGYHRVRLNQSAKDSNNCRKAFQKTGWDGMTHEIAKDFTDGLVKVVESCVSVPTSQVVEDGPANKTYSIKIKGFVISPSGEKRSFLRYSKDRLDYVTFTMIETALQINLAAYYREMGMAGIKLKEGPIA